MRTDFHTAVSSRAPAAHTIARRINHCCEPNLMSVVTNLRRNLCFTAAEAEVLRLPLQAEGTVASSPARAANATRVAGSTRACAGPASVAAAREGAAKRAREAEPASTPLDPGLEPGAVAGSQRACEAGEPEAPLLRGSGKEATRAPATSLADSDDVSSVVSDSVSSSDHIYDVVCFVALREIAPGEELSYGYHRAVQSAVCRCGAVSCRGTY